MRGSRLSRDLFFVSILTAITVLTWIVLDTYRAFTKKDMPKVLQEQLEPLNPEIDTKVFDNLSKRKKFNKEELVLPEISPTPEATRSGQR
ncbi:MAG: hypothetical protein ACOZBZ_00485 [Patescibacteria group bacterium]